MDELLKFKSDNKQATLNINQALKQAKELETLNKVNENKELTRNDISIPLEMANQIGEKKHEAFRDLDKKTDFQIFQNNIDAKQAKETNALKAQQAQETLLYKYDETYDSDILAPIFSTDPQQHLNRVARAIKADKAYDFASNVSIPTELKQSNEMVDLKHQQANSKALDINNFIKKQINDEFQYVKDTYKDYVIAYAKEYNRLGRIGDEALEESYAKAYEITTNKYSEMTQTSGPLDNIIRGVIHTSDGWASLSASLAASLREGTLTFKEAPILEKFLESTFDYKSYNKYEAFGTASVIQDNLRNTLRLLPVANAISTFVESLPEMIELGIMGSGFVKGWNKTVLDARNKLIADKVLTKNMSKHLDRQIKLADFKGNTQLKERLESLRTHLTNPSAKTLTKDEFSSIAGALASTFNKTSFFQGLRLKNAGIMPYTLLAVEYAKRGVDLYKDKPANYELTLADAITPLIHLFVDYAGIVGMLGAKNLFVGAKGSLYNKQEIARLSAKETLTQVEKETLQLLKQTNKTRIGDGLVGSILGNFAVEGFGEMIQTHLEQQVQSGFTLPSLTDMLFNEYHFSSLRQKQEDMYRTGMLGGLGGALAGGVSSIAGNALGIAKDKIEENNETPIKIDTSTQKAFENTDKDLKSILERAEETSKVLQERLKNNYSETESNQSASEFVKQQEESFKQKGELQKNISEYETKSNNETVKQISNVGAKDNRNKIRLVEQRLNKLYSKNQNDITVEEQAEIKELETYKSSLEEQFVKESAIVVTNELASEVLPTQTKITTEQVDLLSKMLQAKTIEEFNNLQKEFIKTLDLSEIDNVEKHIRNIINKDKSKTYAKANEMGQSPENKTADAESKSQYPNQNIRQEHSNQSQTSSHNTNQTNNVDEDINNQDIANQEPKYKTDEELSKERIDNIDPYIVMRALVNASRATNNTQNKNNKEWDNYIKKNTIVRIENDRLTDTSKVKNKKDKQYFSQDDIELFVVSSEIVDDNGNTIQYANGYFEQEFNKAISDLVNAESSIMKKGFIDIQKALDNGDEQEANRLLEQLHEENKKDLNKVKNSLIYIDFITFTNPSGKLAKKLNDIKRRIMYRLEQTNKEIDKLHNAVKKFNQDNTNKQVSDMDTANLLDKISKTTSSIFSGIRNAMSKYINGEIPNSDKAKVSNMFKSLEKILQKLKDLRQDPSFIELQKEVYDGLAKGVYKQSIMSSGILNSTGRKILLKGTFQYLSTPIKILGSDFYGRIHGNDFIYSIIDGIIAKAINSNVNNELIQNLKPILSMIAITPSYTEIKTNSNASATEGQERNYSLKVTLYDYLNPDADTAKKILTDNDWEDLGISKTDNNAIITNIEEIRKRIHKELEKKEIKERLSIAVNNTEVQTQIETLLDIGLVLQAKVIFQNKNATKIASNQTQFLAGEIAKFFDNKSNVTNNEQKEANEHSYAELANTAFALANEFASQKDYGTKEHSLLTINDDNTLTFDDVFKEELAEEYESVIKEWDNILDTEVYSTNDKQKMENLCSRLAKLSDSERKAAIINLQNVSHSIDDTAIKVFKSIFGLDNDRDLVEYVKNAKYIEADTYNNKKNAFYEKIAEGKQQDIDEIRNNPNSEEHFFNYIRVPYFEENNEGALVKKFKYIYVPELTINNQGLKDQFDDDILNLILTTSKTIFDSNVSKLESRTSELGYALFVLANAESSLKNNGNIDNSVKYYENKDDKTGELIEIDYSKPVYYLLGLQDNGRVYIQDSSTSPMTNVFLRDLTVHNIPKQIKKYNNKTKEIDTVDNLHYKNWGGEDMSNVSNTDLRDKSDYENQKLMVLNQLVRSLGIDYDKITFDEQAINALNNDSLKKRIQKALKKVTNGNDNIRLQGYNELIKIIKEYKDNKKINLLRQTYMSKGTINGKKIDIRDLLDRLLSNDKITVKEAIKDYRELLKQVEGSNFKSDHPTLSVRAKESINNAIENDETFNIQKLKLNYGSIYADGSATFMMENAIRLKTHTLNNALSGVSTNKVKTNGNDVARLGATIADIFNNYYVAKDYQVKVEKLIDKLPNDKLREHLKNILKDKGLDPHTLNLATVTAIMNFFGNTTLFSSVLSNSTILDRDTIKPPGTVSSYGSGIEGILNKFLELTFLKQEELTFSIFEELSNDKETKKDIQELLAEQNLDNYNESRAKELESKIISKFQSIINDKYANVLTNNNNKKQNNQSLKQKEIEEETVLSALVGYYSNPDNVAKLLFNPKANINYLEEDAKQFEESIKSLDEKEKNEKIEERERQIRDLRNEINNKYFLFKGFLNETNEGVKDKFNRNQIGEILLNNLTSDIDKILNYYQNFGVIKNGKLDGDVLAHTKELSDLIENKENNAVFRKFFTKEMFDNFNINENNEISNEYFSIEYTPNKDTKYKIILKYEINKKIKEFSKEHNIDENDLKKMILHIAELKQKTGEYYFTHTPLSASAMPLLEIPRQSSRYFNDVIKNVQDKLIKQIYYNITSDLLNELAKVNKNFIGMNIDDFQKRIKNNKELYNILRSYPQIVKNIERKTQRFLDKYFSEVYSNGGIYLNVFNNKPNEEQRKDFMEKQKDAVNDFIKNELKLDANEYTNLYNIISFSMIKSPISASNSITEQQTNLKTSLPNVGALFNHPFEAFFLTAESNNMQIQIFDAMFGTPIAIDGLVGNWNNAGFVPKHNFDNGFVLSKWFYNVDKIAKDLKYNTRDFQNLSEDEKIAEINTLENIIKHYINLTNFFTANTQNIKSLNIELAKDTYPNINLINDFTDALDKLKNIYNILSNTSVQGHNKILTDLKRRINLTTIGTEDINVFSTESWIDGKKTTIIDYINSNENFDIFKIINAFGRRYEKNINKLVSESFDIDVNKKTNNKSLKVISFFRKAISLLTNEFLINNPSPRILSNDAKTNVIQLNDDINVFAKKIKSGETLYSVVDDIFAKLDSLYGLSKKQNKNNDPGYNPYNAAISNVKKYLDNNYNVSVDELLNHIVYEYMSEYLLVESKATEINESNIMADIKEALGDKNLVIHNLHKLQKNNGKIYINKREIDISALLNNEYELFNEILNNQSIKGSLTQEIENITRLIKANNNIGKETAFVNAKIIGGKNRFGINYSLSEYDYLQNKHYYVNPHNNNLDMNDIIYNLANQKRNQQSQNQNLLDIRKESSDTMSPGNIPTKEVNLDEYVNDIIKDIDDNFKAYQNDEAVMRYVNNLKESIKDLARNARMGLRIFYYQNGKGGEFNPNDNTIHIFDTESKTTKLHEFIHAISDFALYSNTNEANILKNKILAIHKQIKSDEKLKSVIPDVGHLLNNDDITNIAETLSIMLSTPSAVKALSEREVRIPFQAGKGKTRLGSMFKALPLLVKYLFQLANHKLKREPSSSLEFLYKTMTDLSNLNTPEGEARLREQYESKPINILNNNFRKVGIAVLDRFLGRTESFKRLTPEEQEFYSKKIKGDVEKAISTSSLLRFGQYIKNYKGSSVTKGVMTALWLLKSTFYKNSNILPFLTNPIQRALVRETIADLRQRVIENTIFDARVMLDFGVYSTNFLKKHINLINRATNARTRVNYEIEAAKYESRQAIKTYLLFTPKLKEMLKDEKDFKTYSESVSKLVFHHNLGDYFIGYDNIPESELKELAYIALNSRSEETRETAQTRINAKINEALYLLKIPNDSDKAKVIKKTIVDLAYTRYSDKLNKYGISNIEMALKRLDIDFNYNDDKQALQNLHQAITLKSIILPYQMKDSSSKYLQEKNNDVLNRYIHEKTLGDTELANDIEKSLQYIINFHAHKLEELYSKKILNRELEEAQDFYKLKKTDRLYFMDNKDMYHKTSALDRFSKDAYYLESFKPYAFNPNKMVISIDPNNLDKQFNSLDDARNYYQILGFKFEKVNDKGIETYSYEGFNQYSNSRETPSFIFQTLDHKGQVFKPLDEEDVNVFKPSINDKFFEQMKKEFLDSSNEYNEDYVPNVNDTYGMSSSKSFAGSETMLRENMSNEELETLTDVDTTAESMFEQMEKYIMENKIKDYVNNQIFYQIIIGNEEIQKNRQASLDDETKHHHTEVLFNIENGRIHFNPELTEKYGIRLTKQDESDFAKMYSLVNGGIDSKSKVYIDTRLLPVIFGFNKNNISENVKKYPLAYKALSAIQKSLSLLIKEGKNNTIIRNPSLVITNATANFFGLVAEGVQLKEMESWAYYTEQLDKYQNDYKEIKTKEARIKELDRARKTLDEQNEIDKLNKDIDNLKKSLKGNSVSPLIESGMYSNIIEDAETTEWKWDEELIKTINTDETKKNYLSEFMMTESSDAYKTLADMTRKGDFIPRVILYYHLINKKNYTKEDALDEVRDRFVNYSTPLFSPTGRLLERTGIMMYQKYRFAIQKQALLAFKNAPVSASAVIATQEVFANMGFNSPWAVSSYLSENLMFGGSLPSGLWNMGVSMFSSVNRWKYVTP